MELGLRLVLDQETKVLGDRPLDGVVGDGAAEQEVVVASGQVERQVVAEAVVV